MSKVKTSNVSRETIYGWFPIDEDKPKRSPTDIYMNLGFRHPKEDSFVENKILKEYVKEIKSENLNEKLNNTDQEVDPPWGLCFKPLPNKPIENSDDKELVLIRSKSAPIEWQPKKLPINIPKPILKNLFYKETKHNYFSLNQKDSSEQEKKISPKLDNENMDEISNEIDRPYFIESFNVGKKPIISHMENEKNCSGNKKARPKTAFIKSTQEQISVNKRPKSTVSIRPKSTVIQMVSEEKFKSNEALKSAIETESSTSANQHESVNEKSKTKTLLENWKSNLLERKKFLHTRPNYFVRIDMNKLQPDSPAPELHYNSPETYFYNTMPFRKATFSIHPSFISENLNIQKIDLKRKDTAGSNKAVRYRRDFAFVY